MVLHGVISPELVRILPALETARYFLPLVAVLAVCLEDNIFLLLGPLSLVDLGVEVIIPPGSAEGYLSRHCLPVRGCM